MIKVSEWLKTVCPAEGRCEHGIQSPGATKSEEQPDRLLQVLVQRVPFLVSPSTVVVSDTQPVTAPVLTVTINGRYRRFALCRTRNFFTLFTS
jgi:hypothetical protein